MFPVIKKFSGSETNKLITQSVMQLRTAPSQIHQTILPTTWHQLLSHRFLFSFIPERKFAKGKSMKFLLSYCWFSLRFHSDDSFLYNSSRKSFLRDGCLQLPSSTQLFTSQRRIFTWKLSARLVMTRGGEAGEFLSDFSTWFHHTFTAIVETLKPKKMSELDIVSERWETFGRYVAFSLYEQHKNQNNYLQSFNPIYIDNLSTQHATASDNLFHQAMRDGRLVRMKLSCHDNVRTRRIVQMQFSILLQWRRIN